MNLFTKKKNRLTDMENKLLVTGGDSRVEGRGDKLGV